MQKKNVSIFFELWRPQSLTHMVSSYFMCLGGSAILIFSNFEIENFFAEISNLIFETYKHLQKVSKFKNFHTFFHLNAPVRNKEDSVWLSTSIVNLRTIKHDFQFYIQCNLVITNLVIPNSPYNEQYYSPKWQFTAEINPVNNDLIRPVSSCSS